jgi:hypothetical protein
MFETGPPVKWTFDETWKPLLLSVQVPSNKSAKGLSRSCPVCEAKAKEWCMEGAMFCDIHAERKNPQLTPGRRRELGRKHEERRKKMAG